MFIALHDEWEKCNVIHKHDLITRVDLSWVQFLPLNYNELK
jgi:hypothetical protein